MNNLTGIYTRAKEILKESGISNSDLETRWILKHVLGVTDADLIGGTERTLWVEEEERIESILQRRLAGEPLSRIFGAREFYGLSFKVTPDVLDPRPETELIIEKALELFSARPPKRILDLG